MFHSDENALSRFLTKLLKWCVENGQKVFPVYLSELHCKEKRTMKILPIKVSHCVLLMRRRWLHKGTKAKYDTKRWADEPADRESC